MKKTADINLTQLPPDISLKIYNRIERYLIQSPQELGKPLIDKYKGLYRYQVWLL